ncbi:MAG: heat-inducible transcriptional repressor HrcA [Chthonomonadales bacterium]
MALDARKGRILQAIVDDYVERADPIASEWLASRYDFGCKSATVRNEMAEMSELGYLAQPHTSAGRIPTERGYRYYVDRLMPRPSFADMPAVAPADVRDATGSPVEDILHHTCRLLASVTQYPSLATPPVGASASLHQIVVTRATPSRAIVVAVLTNGEVEHRLVDLPGSPGDGDLERVANFLNRALGGKSLDDIIRMRRPGDVSMPEPFRQLLGPIFQAIVDVAEALGEHRIFIEGASQILKQPEFHDVTKLEQLLSALEERSVLYRILSRTLLGDDITVLIGSEGQIEAMRDCSIVTANYFIGNRVAGYIGIVGPTRMHYGRAVGAVGWMARNLSALLTHHSFG